MTPQARYLPLPSLFLTHEVNFRYRLYLSILILITAFILKAFPGSAMNSGMIFPSGPDSISSQDFQSLAYVSSSIVATESNLSIQVAPNPSQGKVCILLPQELSGMTGRISILDETGKCVYSSLMNPGNPESMTIDLSTNRKGKYTALIKGNKGSFRSSFLLIH